MIISKIAEDAREKAKAIATSGRLMALVTIISKIRIAFMVA